ncbi:SdrD B-like domain-containing protein, partial [Canibacter zhoujuaniae]|uniref:SdrD B-like domain-containing protein n=1 Tax=Canibacter zhoujuaniae TaxID=2708343 RepID=UPI001AB01FEF
MSTEVSKTRFSAVLKRLLVAVLGLVLVAAGVVGPAAIPAAQAVEAQDLVMRLGTSDSVIQDGLQPRLEYPSGESIPASVRLETSNLDPIPHAVVRVEVLKGNPVDPANPNTDDKYIADPAFPSSAFAEKTERGEDPEKWWIEYTFKALEGSNSYEYPFPFQFKNFVTPDGTTATVNASVRDAAGEVLREQSVTFTGRASSEYTSRKEGQAYSWHPDSAGQTVRGEGGIYIFSPTITHNDEWSAEKTLENVTKVPGDFGEANLSLYGNTVRYRLCVTNVPLPGEDRGVGVYRGTTATIVDYFPEGATLDTTHSTNRDWVLAEDGKSASKTVQLSEDKNEICDYIRLTYTGLPVSTDGQPVRSDYSNAVIYRNRAVTTIDQGLPSEKVLPEVKWDHAYRITERRVFFHSSQTIYTSKNVPYNNYVYSNGKFFHRYAGLNRSFDRSGDGFTWELSVRDQNNGANFEHTSPARGGQITELSEIRDYNLDPRLYFNEARLRVGAINAQRTYLTRDEAEARVLTARPYLVGVGPDGTETEIAEITSLGEPVTINDRGRAFNELKLRFKNGPLQLDNFDVELNLYALPNEAEWARWAKGDYTAEQYDNHADFTFQRVQYELIENVNTDGTVTYTDGKAITNFPVETRTDSNQNAVRVSSSDPRVRMVANSNYDLVPYINCEAEVPAGRQLTPDNCGRMKKFNFSYQPFNSTSFTNQETFTGLEGVVLLPPGVEYVNTIYTQYNGWSHYPHRTGDSYIEPKVVPNYLNTGRTGLIYEFPKELKPQGNREVAKVELVLDTTLYAKQGRNEIDFFWTWQNNTDYGSPRASDVNGAGGYRDELDLDGDGDREEFFLHNTRYVNFVPPLEVLAKKYVSVDGKNWSFDAPVQDLGGDLFYRLEVSNGDRLPVSSLHLIDVVPSLEDYSIVDGYTADSPNERVYSPRTWQKVNADGTVETVTHSAYVTPLVSALEDVEQNNTVQRGVDRSANDLFTFMYSVTEQAKSGDILASVRDSRWYTKDEFVAAFGDTADAWAQVKSIRADLKEGAAIPATTDVSIVAQAKIPFTAETRALDSGVKAVNTVAMSRDGVNYLQGNSVRSEVVDYSVSGIVFHDLNQNGNRDADEPLLPGYTVELVNADGTPAKHPDGAPIPAVQSGDNGEYSFDVYARGDYLVNFTKNERERFTTLGDGAANIANHVKDVRGNSGATEKFTLTPNHRHDIRNAGLTPTVGVVKVLKTVAGVDPGPGVKFELAWKEALAGVPAPERLPE